MDTSTAAQRAKIGLQLERLKRNYEAAYQTYDLISLWEMSATLRIWADMKGTVSTYFPKFANPLAFKSASPSKQILRNAKDRAHVIAYMPGAVTTRAFNGAAVAAVEGAVGDSSLTVSVRLTSSGALELKNYAFIDGSAQPPPDPKPDQERVTRGNFVQWLGSEVVRVAYKNADGQLESVAIAREMLIRRIANVYDGSHPSISPTTEDLGNRFDPPIQHLFKFKAGGLPLPYFLLLKVAQDILAAAPQLLVDDGNDDASKR